MSGIELGDRSLDILMPLYLVVDPEGIIRASGRTIPKLLECDNLVGRHLLDVLTITKPRGAGGVEKLAQSVSKRMRMESCGPMKVKLRAVAVPCADGGCFFISTAIAADVAKVVEELGLKNGDFSPADGTIDLVYAIQMQGSILEDARQMADKIGQAKDEAERRAMTDELTGLSNRRALIGEIDRQLAIMEGSEKPFAVLQVDLDRFKQVNDTLGHDAGDAVLLHVAAVLRSAAETCGFVSRIGGDEFVIVVNPDVSQVDLASMSKEIIDRISLPIPFGEHLCKIGASVGITRPSSARQTSAELLTEADLALYESKRNGRGRYYFFAKRMRTRMRDLTRLSTEIAEALEVGQFEPFFQPQVRLSDGALVGCEVLARWRHPERGILPPSQFLFAADQANLLHRLDQYMMEKAFDQVGQWVASGIEFPGMSVNVTATALADEGFLDRLKWMTDLAGLIPEMVGLEILESVILGDDDAGLVDRINRLGDAGFRIFLDDFGTDRASISNLRQLRLDKIKIDRSFVSGLDRDSELRLMSGAMIDLARRLGIGTIAEGVETEEEAAVLIELGCESCQGYLVSRPVDAVALAAWLSGNERFRLLRAAG